MEPVAEQESLVRTLLEKEGLTVPDDEITQMTAVYGVFFANTAALYFPEVQYESPALIYSADA